MISVVLKWILVIIVTFTLQTTIVPMLAIAGIQPDLILIVIALISFSYGSTFGIYTGFIIGLGIDTQSITFLGQHALAKTIFGSFIGIFNERVMRTDLILKIVVLGVGIVFHELIFQAIDLIKNGYSLSFLFMSIFTKMLPRALYTVFIALLIQLWKTFVHQSISSRRY